MKQNIKSAKKAKIICGADIVTIGTNYINDDYLVTGSTNTVCNKDDIFGLKTHKMKRSNKDTKSGDKYLKHITLKSIRISFANLFKPSKRIGRNQQNVLFTEETSKCQMNHVPQNPQIVKNIISTTSAQVVTTVTSRPQSKAVDIYTDLEKRGLKRQFNEFGNCPQRCMTVTNICTLSNQIATKVTNSAQLPSNAQRKVQPSMGLKVISVKTAKTRDASQPPRTVPQHRELVPFLDSIEHFMPVTSSTFIKSKQRESVESVKSSSSNESLTKVTPSVISPVSINSSRNRRKQVRSISVMNVSSIMSNQF